VAAADDSSFYQVLAPLDTAELRTEALAQSPQVRSAEASATAAQASVKAAQAAYWPSLTLSASTGWNGRNPDYDFTNNKQISLGLSWNIFNGFNREQQISISKSQSDVAQAQADDAKRQVAANLTSQLAQLDAARIRIGITRTSVTAAKEDLRVVQERYRLGVATIVDVLTSQEALDQAEVDEVNARFDYLRAKAQLEALIGRKL
jgi:outer membrane protein TolC